MFFKHLQSARDIRKVIERQCHEEQSTVKLKIKLISIVKEDRSPHSPLTRLLDENLHEPRGLLGKLIPRSIWVSQPLLHSAVVRPRVAALGPVQGQHVGTRWEPLSLQPPPQSLLIGVRAVLKGPRVFDSQQELVSPWSGCMSHIPRHSVLGGLAGLGGDGAIDLDATVLWERQGLIGLLDSQLAYCKE